MEKFFNQRELELSQKAEQSIQQGFGKTLVKGQRTRWASCSRHKTVSINHKLLFLPRHLVRYVFIHELSHTIHMNHSKKFWAAVGVKEPDYQKLDDELRDAWRYVPAWMEKTHR